MKTKRKIKGTRNPLFLHINNLIMRKEFFSVVLLFCSYHHVMDDKLLTLLLFRFYASVLGYLKSMEANADAEVTSDSVMSEIRSICYVCPSMYDCIEYLFNKYGVMKGGVL